MIKEITMFTVICDKCGKDSSDGTGYSGWTDKIFVIDQANEADWEEIADKNYCPDCWQWSDDETDIIPKP